MGEETNRIFGIFSQIVSANVQCQLKRSSKSTMIYPHVSVVLFGKCVTVWAATLIFIPGLGRLVHLLKSREIIEKSNSISLERCHIFYR